MSDSLGGSEDIAVLKARSPTVPIVVLRDINDENTALSVLGWGAQNCLVKGRFHRELLVRSIHYAIERQQIEEQLRPPALRERLLGKTIEHIRSSIDAASILQSTVAQVRQFLKTDRVLIYRCQDWASQLDAKEQKGAIVAGDRKHPGYKPPDSFRKQTQDPEIKNLYPMKLAERIYPWGQCFNSLI